MGMPSHGNIRRNALAIFDFGARPAYKKIRAAHAKEKQQIQQKRAAARIALTSYFDSTRMRPFEYL